MNWNTGLVWSCKVLLPNHVDPDKGGTFRFFNAQAQRRSNMVQTSVDQKRVTREAEAEPEADAQFYSNHLGAYTTPYSGFGYTGYPNTQIAYTGYPNTHTTYMGYSNSHIAYTGYPYAQKAFKGYSYFSSPYTTYQHQYY